jgi:hypothetical protein
LDTSTTLESPNPVTDGDFGTSISTNGSRVIVGQPGVSKAYVYVYVNYEWIVEATFSSENVNFGKLVFVYGNTCVVADDDNVYFFKYATTWSQEQFVALPNVTSISTYGTTTVFGIASLDVVIVYDFIIDTWTSTHQVRAKVNVPGNNFGKSVSIYQTSLIVGSDVRATLFQYQTQTWTHTKYWNANVLDIDVKGDFILVTTSSKSMLIQNFINAFTTSGGLACALTQTKYFVVDGTALKTGNLNPLTVSGTSTNALPTGSVTTFIEDGFPPYAYAWSVIGNLFSDVSSTEATDVSSITTKNLTNVNPGIYKITVTDSSNQVGEFTFYVQTFMITPGIVTNPTSESARDGSIGETIVSGGSGTYVCAWSGEVGTPNSFEAKTNLRAGNYTVIIHDVIHSSSSITYTYRVSYPRVITNYTTPDSDSPGFGSSISMDGQFGIIGSAGAAFLFTRDTYDNTSSWTLSHKWTGGETFGATVCLNGNVAVVSETGAQRVHIYDCTTFEETQFLSTTADSISMFNNVLVIGEKGVAAHVYSYDTTWALVSTFEDSTTNYAISVACSATKIFVGSPAYSKTNASECGCVYVFEYYGTWSLSRTLTAIDFFENQHFGTSVSYDGISEGDLVNGRTYLAVGCGTINYVFDGSYQQTKFYSTVSGKVVARGGVVLAGDVLYESASNSIIKRFSNTASSNCITEKYVGICDSSNQKFFEEALNPISIIPGIVRHVNHGFGSTGSIGEPTITGGKGILTFTWPEISGLSSKIASGLAPSSYHFTVTDSTGLSRTIEYVVEELPPVSIPPFTVTHCSTVQSSDGRVTAGTIEGGKSPYTYEWKKISVRGSNYANGYLFPTLQNLLPGSYELKVTDEQQAFATRQITVSYYETPSAAVTGIVGIAVACSGQNAAVSDGSSVYIYTRSSYDKNGTWSLSRTIEEARASLKMDGDVLLCANADSVFVYTVSTGSLVDTWTLTYTSYDICNTHAIVGSSGNAYLYSYENGAWSSVNTFTNADAGYGGLTSISETHAFVASSTDVYAYPLAGGDPTVITTESTSLSAKGNLLIIGKAGGADVYVSLTYAKTIQGNGVSVKTNGYDVLVTSATGINIYDSSFELMRVVQGSFTNFSESQNYWTSVSASGMYSGITNPIRVDAVVQRVYGTSVLGTIESIMVNGGLGPYTYEWTVITQTTIDDLVNLELGTYVLTVTDSILQTSSRTFVIDAITSLEYTKGIVTHATSSTSEDASISSSEVSGGSGSYTVVWTSSEGSTVITEDSNLNSKTLLKKGKYVVSIVDAEAPNNIVSWEYDITSSHTLPTLITAPVLLMASAKGYVTVASTDSVITYKPDEYGPNGTWTESHAISGVATCLDARNTKYAFATTNSVFIVSSVDNSVQELSESGVVSLSLYGDYIALGKAGEVKLYDGQSLVNTITSIDNTYGSSVSIYGSTVAVGCPGESKVYFYDLTGSETSVTTSDSSSFGISVSLATDRCAIGASGKAFVYAFDAGTWHQDAMLTSGTSVSNFGIRVRMGSGDKCIIDDDSKTYWFSSSITNVWSKKYVFGGSGFTDENCIYYFGESAVRGSFVNPLTIAPGIVGIGRIASTTVEGGSPPYSVTWTNLALTKTDLNEVTDLFAGSYVVRIEDSLGQVISHSYTVAVGVAPITIYPGSITKVGKKGSSTGVIAAPTHEARDPPYTYAWTSDATTVSNPTVLETKTGLKAGNYVLRVTNSKGVYGEYVFAVAENPELKLKPRGSRNALRHGDKTGFIDITDVEGGDGSYTYTWSYTAF